MLLCARPGAWSPLVVVVAARVAAAVIPSPRRGRAAWSDAHRFAGPIKSATAAWRSDPTTVSRESGAGTASDGVRGEAADEAVAHAVVDEDEQFASGGDLGDLLCRGAAPVDDPLVGAAHRRTFRCSLDGFDCSPADQWRALLGDGAAVHGCVRLAVPRCQ